MNDIKSPAGNKSLVNNPTDYSTTRARFFKINSPEANYTQYIATIRAYALAGMPFEHIANAGDSIGDSIERGEVDAPLIEGWQEKAGEEAEGKSKFLAWQNRGEVISIAHQLASANPGGGQELISSYQNLTTKAPEQKINVLEGISVTNNPQNLVNAQKDSELDNNPYLKTIPQDIKKAA